MFPDLTETFRWLFRGQYSSKFFQTLHCYNLALGLPIHTRFDDLDPFSRAQMRQNHKLQIFFQILVHFGLNVDWAQYALCDWCVFKRRN